MGDTTHDKTRYDNMTWYNDTIGSYDGIRYDDAIGHDTTQHDTEGRDDPA